MDLDYIETSDPPVYDNDVDQSKKEKKKDKSGRYVIYTVIFIIILITALVQYSQYRVQIKDFQEITGRNIKAVVDDSYVFNGVEFSLIDGLWYFTLDNPHTKKTYNIPLHYGPKDLVDVPLIGELGEGFSNDDQVYITFLPEDGLTERQSFISLAVAELSLNLRQAINRKIIAACTENNTLACYDREIITCEILIGQLYLLIIVMKQK